MENNYQNAPAAFCGKCGNRLKPGDSFCSACGAPCNQPAAQPVQQTVYNQPVQQQPVYAPPANSQVNYRAPLQNTVRKPTILPAVIICASAFMIDIVYRLLNFRAYFTYDFSYFEGVMSAVIGILYIVVFCVSCVFPLIYALTAYRKNSPVTLMMGFAFMGIVINESLTVFNYTYYFLLRGVFRFDVITYVVLCFINVCLFTVAMILMFANKPKKPYLIVSSVILLINKSLIFLIVMIDYIFIYQITNPLEYIGVFLINFDQVLFSIGLLVFSIVYRPIKKTV